MSGKELNSIIGRAEDEYQKLKDKVIEQSLEIERLNNIINELENELYKFYAYEGYNDEQIKDKIKELEGSGSDKE